MIFKPTHNDAKKLYDKLKKVKPKTALFKKDGLEADVTYDEYWDTVITHSRGNIGRGIDLPEYDTVIVDASIYLPFLALNLKLEEMTEENILLALDNDRFMIAIQNMGRILRVKEDDKDKISRKCIIIEGISNDDLKLLLEISNLQSMIKNKIQTIHYKNNPQNIFESAKEYLEKGEVVNIKEISPVDKAVNEGLSSICKSDREKYKLEIEEAKREKKLKEIKDDIKSLKETGMCWSKIARKLNLYKLIERYNLDLEDLKSYFRSI